MLAATSVAATTFTWTEGDGENRKRVADSTDLEDASNGSPGFDLNLSNGGDAFAFDDKLQIHGRIVGARDTFSFDFEFGAGFTVEFDLDGYELAAGLIGSDGVSSYEQLSGLVDQDGRGGNPFVQDDPDGKFVKFTLTGGGSSESRTFQTNVLDGDDPFIFRGKANTRYTLTVDGRSPRSTKNFDALYDLTISTVPLPAGAWLMIGAFGGLAAMRRRKKA